MSAEGNLRRQLCRDTAGQQVKLIHRTSTKSGLIEAPVF
jgi:hypothetical protein